MVHFKILDASVVDDGVTAGEGGVKIQKEERGKDGEVKKKRKEIFLRKQVVGCMTGATASIHKDMRGANESQTTSLQRAIPEAGKVIGCCRCQLLVPFPSLPLLAEEQTVVLYLPRIVFKVGAEVATLWEIGDVVLSVHVCICCRLETAGRCQQRCSS